MPVTWTLAVNGSSANLSGVASGKYTFTPKAAGTYTFYLNATDSVGSRSATTLAVTVKAALSPGTISTTPFPTNVSQPTKIATTGATGGIGPYTYAWKGLPVGCSNPGNVSSFTCVPTGGGTFTLTLHVTDAIHVTVTTTLRLDVFIPVTFAESGLPAGATWYVNITGQAPLSSTATTLTTALANGSYLYSTPLVLHTHWYLWTTGTGLSSFQISGVPISESVPYVYTYAVVFDQPGRTSSGTNWSVTLRASAVLALMTAPPTQYTWSSTASTITAYEPNGTYSYWVHVSGHSSYNGTGTVYVSGASVTVTPASLPSPSPAWLWPAIIAVVVVVVIILALLLLRRRRPSPAPPEPAPAYYGGTAPEGEPTEMDAGSDDLPEPEAPGEPDGLEPPAS